MKKITLLPLSLLLVAGLLLTGCQFRIVTGSGNVVEETYELSGYTSVTLAGIGDVILTQAEFQPVRVEAEENLIPYFEVKVEGSSLVIGLKDEYLGVNLQPTRPVKFYVSLPEVETLTLAGSGNILAGGLQTGDLRLSLLGSGNVVEETYELSGYTSVTLAGIGDVILTQAEFQPVRVEAEENLIPYFEVKVEGSSLVIGLKDEYLGVNLQPTRPVKFYVSLPEVETLTLAGSGNILAGGLQTGDLRLSLLGSGNVSTGDVESAGLNVNLAGSGNVTLQAVQATDVELSILGSGNVTLASLMADQLTSTISGSGDVTVNAGQVDDQQINILGSGDYLAAGLESQTASVQVSGSGNTRLQATSSLDVNILGSGDVLYTGQPVMNVNISGSGQVRQGGE